MRSGAPDGVGDSGLDLTAVEAVMTKAATNAEVLRLADEGRGDDAIARKLGVTRHRVRMVLADKTRHPAVIETEPQSASEFAVRIMAAYQKTVWGYIEAGRWL